QAGRVVARGDRRRGLTTPHGTAGRPASRPRRGSPRAAHSGTAARVRKTSHGLNDGRARGKHGVPSVSVTDRDLLKEPPCPRPRAPPPTRVSSPHSTRPSSSPRPARPHRGTGPVGGSTAGTRRTRPSGATAAAR